MWNGLWKLTALVGVIGVGSYAAYQAQQSLSRPAIVGTSESDADSSKSDSTKSLVADGPSDGTSDVFADSEPKPRALRQQKAKNSQSQIDLLDNYSDDQPAVKTAIGSGKSRAQIVTSKRNQPKDFDVKKDPSEFEDASREVSGKPKTLPDESSTDSLAKRPRQSIRQVSSQSNDNGNPNTDDVNPFDDAPPVSEPVAEKTQKSTVSTDDVESSLTQKGSKPLAAEDNSDTPPSEPQTPPGRARISTDASMDSDIPRSNRARKNAAKRTEQPVESDSNPFGDDPGTTATSSRSIPDSRSTSDAPQLGAPEQLDVSNNSTPVYTRDSNQQSPPLSLPPDSSMNSSDDEPLPRSLPKRSRQPQPIQPPADLNTDMLSDPPPRSREPSKRQSEYDRVMPVDMVGDGVAGDVSQRGVQQPRLTIEKKVAQQQVVLEQPLVYTIIVRNAGSVDAHNIVIEDRIPKGTELQGTFPQAEMSGKLLTWKQALLKPNEEAQIKIKVIPKQEGPIGSVARVYFATEVTAEIVVTAPQLEFTVKAPNEVRIGQRFDMVFNLKNIGKVDATNIIVRDLVPDQLKHEAGTDIECPIGKMAPQEVREIVLPVIAMKTGSVTNKAILTADSGIKRTLDSPIDIVGEVLVLTRSGQNHLYVERPAVFTNNIRNDGNQRADRVKISEVVPAGMEFETASDGGMYDSNLRAVVWTLGPLAPGSDKSVTVKYVPREIGTRGAKVTAVGNAGSTASVNASVEVIGKPELQMETLSATGAVTLGDRITSRFQLNNTGTASASNVQMKVKLPAELKLISVKGANYQEKNGYVLFEPIAELGPRKKVAFELVLEPIAEADAQIGLEISADHLKTPGRRVETIQIARDTLKY